MELKISHIQTFSLQDGPGIRTTVFLSGCPLRCPWCHNPETQSLTSELLFEKEKCIGCGKCAVCPQGVHAFTPEHTLRRQLCRMCGDCTALCPTGALRPSVTGLTPEAFQKLADEQLRLFGSDGGITFSGGEPLLQWQTVSRFLDGVRIHIAVETCGYAPRQTFAQMLAQTDYVMLDVKLADDRLHRQYTGVSNRPILENLELLRRSGKPYLIRTPLIPGITDTQENLTQIRALIGDSPWEHLPCNTLAPVKYAWLGREYPL